MISRATTSSSSSTLSTDSSRQFLLQDNRLSKSLDRLKCKKSPRRASNELFSLEFLLIELTVSLQLEADKLDDDDDPNKMVDEIKFLLNNLRELEDRPFYSKRSAYNRFLAYLNTFCSNYVIGDESSDKMSFQLERCGHEVVFREISLFE